MKFERCADAKFIQSIGKHTDKDHEDFINEKKFFTSNRSNKKYFLEFGENYYPFRTFIPITSPTSFECVYGLIKYIIEADVHILWATSVNINMFLTVIGKVDLTLLLDFPKIC